MKTKSKPLRSVQWFSNCEWKLVFELIFGPDSDDEKKARALQILLVWKLRSPYLPSGIESTLILLEVEQQKCSPEAPDRMLRLMYSGAVMRFLNFTVDNMQQKKVPLQQAALHLEIPQWVVQLRNEMAHGHELPPLQQLQKAARFAMNWLFTAYWEPTSKTISNYEISKAPDMLQDELYKLLTMHNLLATLSHPSFKINLITDIPDKELRQNLLNDLRLILNAKIPNLIPLSEAAQKLCNVLENYVKSNAQRNNFSNIFCDIFTNQDSLFMDEDSAQPDGCAHLWEPILCLMQSENLISPLIRKLMEIANNSEEIPKRRKCAAQWLKQIFNALNKNHIYNRVISDTREKLSTKTENLVKKIKNETTGLTLDVSQNIPYDICHLDFVQTNLKNPNPNLIIYAREMIALLNQKIDRDTSKKLLQVVDIFNKCKAGGTFSDRIYTVDDFGTLTDNSFTQVSGNSENGQSIWKIINEDYEWDTCPIGVLPWQKHSYQNPLL